MFKFLLLLAISFCAVCAKPKPSVFAAPLAVAPALVTAQSSQVIARNYNALVAPAPVLAPAPVVAAVRVPLVAAHAPLVAASYRAAPVLASPYVAAPYLGAPAVAAAW